MRSTTAVGASHGGFCVAAATRRAGARVLSGAADSCTDVERAAPFAFSEISPPAGVTGSFAEAVAFAFDVACRDDFFLLLAMKRCSLDAAGRAGVPRGPAGAGLGLG